MKKRSRSNVNPIHVMVKNGSGGYPKNIKVRIHVEGDVPAVEINMPHNLGMFVVGDAGREYFDDIFGPGRVECVEILWR